ncbi:hypothetical protein MIR68_009086 [Amoeboaphelidium protococcarum]|nr:hypothetical protein MIR68_009086 [Amoeboaphelidium protococcarum]KAI3648785.1 hypothetical protein MP228_006639 [Amoeboaphelidium protococcarum]
MQGFLRSESQCYTQQELLQLLEKATTVFQRLHGGQIVFDRAQLGPFITSLRSAVDHLGLDVRRFQDPRSNEILYMLVNVREDSIVKNENVASTQQLIGTDLSLNELGVLRRWIDAIADAGANYETDDDDDGNANDSADAQMHKWSISMTEALNIALFPTEESDQNVKLSAKEAQNLVRKLVAQRWLVKIKVDEATAAQNDDINHIALGPRALVELKSLLSRKNN